MDMLIVISLIFLNGLFAMSEVALLTARRSKLASLASSGDAMAAAAIKLSADPTKFLSTIQIGITSIGLLNGIFGEAVFAAPLSAWLQLFGLEAQASNIAATTVIVVSITYATIVVGELVPKRIEDHAREIISGGTHLVSFGGDHFVSYPLLSAHRETVAPPAAGLACTTVGDSSCGARLAPVAARPYRTRR